MTTGRISSGQRATNFSTKSDPLCFMVTRRYVPSRLGGAAGARSGFGPAFFRQPTATAKRTGRTAEQVVGMVGPVEGTGNRDQIIAVKKHPQEPPLAA